MPVEIVGQRGAHLGREQRARADVEREERPLGPAVRAQRRAQRRGLERRPEPGAVRLVEPLVGRAERAVGHPRQRLVAGDAAGGELQHGLEHRHDRALARRAAPRPRRAGRRPRAGRPGGGRSGGSGRGPSAWPSTARRRRARAGARRRARRRGSEATPAEHESGRPPTSTSATAARARSAASVARSPSTPGRISANSSPPRRATTSSSRTAERSFSAAAISTLSPSAWP